MTYFGFLLIFLVIPIIVLLAAAIRSRRSVPRFWCAIGAQVVLALIYTTPWDNHLVATGVWYYNRKLVTGIVLGYVPVEEYTFFGFETLLAGLWWQLCSARLDRLSEFRPSRGLRLSSAGGAAVLWILLAFIFFKGWIPGTYLLITLLWALPPIILQLAFGADILWHARWLVAATIIPLGIYLSAADALAIRTGIWAINRGQSTDVFIGGLPIEEAVFFFITIILISFGMTLTLARESRKRLPLPSRNNEQAPIRE